WRGRQLRRYERAPIHARGPIARAQPNPTDSMAIAAVTVAGMKHRRTRSWPGVTATSGFIATSGGWCEPLPVALRRLGPDGLWFAWGVLGARRITGGALRLPGTQPGRSGCVAHQAPLASALKQYPTASGGISL